MIPSLDVLFESFPTESRDFSDLKPSLRLIVLFFCGVLIHVVIERPKNMMLATISRPTTCVVRPLATGQNACHDDCA